MTSKVGAAQASKDIASKASAALANPFFAKVQESMMFRNMPNLTVTPIKSKDSVGRLSGPCLDDLEPKAESYGDFCSGRTVSTYPIIPEHKQRFGDPIADCFGSCIFADRAVLCVTDGCNWGARVQESANRACSAFVTYVANHIEKAVDMKSCRDLLLEGASAAQEAIFVQKKPVGGYYDCGMTTLLGGIVVPIEPKDQFCPSYEFLCVSVGDCKAFIYTSSGVEDVTVANRSNATDARDCGGRLGPANDIPDCDDVRLLADLSNLCLYSMPCEVDDVIMIVSDGVHDNLDPQHLGKLPKDMPKSMNLGDSDKWEAVDDVRADSAKNAFRIAFLEKRVQGASTPLELVDRLLGHCTAITASSRKFMCENGGKKVPSDYSLYPGKMDHTTVLALRIASSFELGVEAATEREKEEGMLDIPDI